MSALARPEIGTEYFAPIALSSVQPIVWGEARGILVDEPSQSAGVVYSTREAADAALADPTVWAPSNAAHVRVARLRYRGVGAWGRFDFADEAERTAHLEATQR